MDCRVCGHGITPYLDLGTTPLANSYLTEDQLYEPEPMFPLVVGFCSGCGLSQLSEVVDPDLMFRNYLYVSSTSQTLRDHFDGLAAEAVRSAAAGPNDLALDIASNDGYLLSRFAERGLGVVGVDPAMNLAKDAIARGIPTICDYWTMDSARGIGFGRAKIVTATNVLGHVDRVHAFVAAVERVLNDEGVFIIEVPYLLDLIGHTEYDTVYHEHLSYWMVSPLAELLAAHGLAVFDVQYFPDIHGGTIRAWSSKSRHPLPVVAGWLEKEREFKTPAPYLSFADRVRMHRDRLVGQIDAACAAGATVWAYGAAAKGNTLMNYLGLFPGTIPVVIDDNPRKWGLYTPGAHMRIAPPSELQSSFPGPILLLAWNFKEEIVRRCREIGYSGGFIVP